MKAIVTGAAGFTGCILCEVLRKSGIEVYAIVREGSEHNKRLETEDSKLHVIEARLGHLTEDSLDIPADCDLFFHIAWGGSKDVAGQYMNVEYTMDALRAAKKYGCKRFIATGSQAEYGVVPMSENQTEDRMPDPFTAYGTCKVAACYLSRQLAKELGIEWIWGRIFSLIGRYEPSGRMLPDLYAALTRGEQFNISSCRQNWDYLDVYDAAEAILALALKGRGGKIYNIAHGEYRPLRQYTEELYKILGQRGKIIYGDDPSPLVSLQPSVDKIRQDTGWQPKRSFEQSIRDYGTY